MKLVHFSAADFSSQWGDNANPNTLNYNDVVFGNFITSKDTIDADGNIINSSNGGINRYNNGTITAPIRLVAEFGDSTFLSPNATLINWVKTTNINADPSVLNRLSATENPLFFLGLNEVVQNDGTNDYFEVSLTAYTKKPNSTIPSVIKANGVYEASNSGVQMIGWFFFNKSLGEFDLVGLNNGGTPYGFLCLGIGDHQYETERLGIAKALTTKNFNRKYGRNAYFLYDAVDLGSFPVMEVSFDGVVDTSLYLLEFNSTGVRAYIKDSINAIELIAYSDLALGVDWDNILLVPAYAKVLTKPTGYTKRIEFSI